MTGQELMTRPECPNGHGPMTLRERPSEIDRWCGTWYDCTPSRVSCASSVLLPSPELIAFHASLAGAR